MQQETMNFSVIVFDDTQDNKRLIDGDLVKVVYRNTSEDIMVCKLRDSFPSPFKNMSKWFKEDADLYDQENSLTRDPLLRSTWKN